MLEHEIDEASKQQQSIEADIVNAEKEIEELRAELAREKQLRQHKEEYEALAKVINKYAPLARSTSEIEQLQVESAEVDAEAARIGDTVRTRKRQFALLMQTIFDLQHMLEEDTQAEDELPSSASSGGSRKRPRP